MNRAITPTGYLRLNWLAAKGRSGAEVALRVFYVALPFFIWAAVAIFLGFLVGFSAVILPPTGTFGIVAAVGLVLLWVTPDLPQPPARSLPYLFAIVVFCMLCIPNYYAIDIPGLPWIIVSPAVSDRPDPAVRDRSRRILPLPRRHPQKACK